jgi:UDP-glucose 4-epimerase
MKASNQGDRTVIVTGGCGYIGSHTIVCLLEQKFNVVVVDNLVNSSRVSLDRVCEIVGLKEKDRESRLRFCNVDICNENDLRQIFLEQKRLGKSFCSCIHFAGLKVLYQVYNCIVFVPIAQVIVLFLFLGSWRKHQNSH